MINRSELFKLAWNNAKTAAGLFGGLSARARFGSCLRAAWAGAKAKAARVIVPVSRSVAPVNQPRRFGRPWARSTAYDGGAWVGH